MDIIALLLKHDADVNAQSLTGNFSLMKASASGYEDAVRLLLKRDANMEDHIEKGHSPLMKVASTGRVGVVKVSCNLLLPQIFLEHSAGNNTHSKEFKETGLTLTC